ncbi:sensor histidine kinase [Paenibacillus sp. P96]|uniref:Sensor histidine kinase n=1 Tax=Paenibacillus zeirhizosphaerae TaxID=2987519 RepID=A0ABT9FVS8_9BACL|nr:sensor histidine kinase [Paenibacillus sp. P96]MDP4098842.1 sensor histidine kinase [Paenibacillus sp. P96]
MSFQRLLRTILLRDRSLMTKLTVYSAILVLVPMLLVGYISYRQSSLTLENEARRYSWQIIDQVKHYVEDYFRDFEISTLKIINHPDTTAFLRAYTGGKPTDADHESRVRNVLQNSAFSRSDVANISLILDHERIIDSNDQPGVVSVWNVEREAWFDTVPVTGKPKVLARLIHWKEDTKPVVSVAKRIASPKDLKPFGMLVIDLNYKRLEDTARKVRLGASGSGFLMILDDEGRYVYHPDQELIGKLANYRIVREIQYRSSGSFIFDENGKRLLTFSRSEALNWKIVTSIPYKELMESRTMMGHVIFATTAWSMLIAYVLSLGFAASLIRPIKKLHLYMKRVEIGDFKGHIKVETGDEVGMLTADYNRMVNRLSELLEEVYVSRVKEAESHLRHKETELRMLQAQMNPHFLYNALETIRGMALAEEREEIADMSAALSRLLRYNVKEDKPVVTVRQELAVVEMYLRIQKYRFDERLEYSIHLPDWVLDQQLPKFTLQPLAENCIVHGLEPSMIGISITLSAVRVGSTFMLAVSDNGPGMTPDRLEIVHRSLTNSNARSTGHIGIDNVNRRIRYLFGEPFGLAIDSIPSEGTTVHMVLPYKEMNLFHGKDGGKGWHDTSDSAGGGREMGKDRTS